jgi:quercetin dioxygenase-like cupin family protein
MSGKFIKRDVLEQTSIEWGTLAFISQPPATGARQLTVIEVILTPGNGHNFHKHPDQEEVIYIVEGHIEQWLETERMQLGPGEAVFIPANLVHASFNIGDQPAKFLVTLGPCVGESGYDLVDVAGDAPWKDLR